MTSDKPAIVLGTQLYLILLILINGSNAYHYLTITGSIFSISSYITLFFVVVIIASELKSKWSHRFTAGSIALVTLGLVYLLVQDYRIHALASSNFTVLTVFLTLSTWVFYLYAFNPLSLQYYQRTKKAMS